MASPIHRDALSAWRHLCECGGLELNGRDEGLDERILTQLDPRAKSVEQALASTDMAAFVRAFFDALHPYVAMFRDILDFFEQADATRGKAQWRLGVDDIDLDLEHFRQWLASSDAIARTGMPVAAIDARAVWQLWEVLRQHPTIEAEMQKAFGGDVNHLPSDVRHWFTAYKQGSYLPIPESLRPLRCPPPLAKSVAIVGAVLQQLLDKGLTRDSLKQLYDWHRRADLPYEMRSDPSDGFNFWVIAQHETDHCLRTLIVALSAASALPDEELLSVGAALDAIIDKFPVRHMNVNVPLATLDSILSLPVWEKRFDLYSVWIATEVIRALDGHEVEIHHDKGRIAFDFKETTIATIHSSPGPFRLISERRVPLKNPVGEHRKGGVQPDHGLWTTADGNEICKLVVEVKHYKSSSKAKFVAVFEDYARAHPKASAFLVNHGPVGSAVYEVSSPVQDRCKAIGRLTSSNSEARHELGTAVRNCVGEPIACWPAEEQPLDASKVLLIDISDSMRATLQSQAFDLFIRQLADEERPAKLAAADEAIAGIWHTGQAGFDLLLGLKGGATDLQRAVAELLNSHALVLLVTDADGLGTIQNFTVKHHAAQPLAPAGIEVRTVKHPT